VSEHQEAHQPTPESTTSPQPQETESPTPRPSEAASQAPDQPAPQAQQPKQLIETGKQAIAKLTNKLQQVSSSPPKETSELQEKLKQEIGTAWQFTKDKVFPSVLNGIIWLVDTLDPPMAQVGAKIAETVQSNPNWTKLTESNIWKQVSTVSLSIMRSLGEVWGKATANITVSDQVKHIASKKSALTTLLMVLLLFLLLKPSPAPKVAKSPMPVAKAPVASAPQAQVPVAVQKQVLAIAQNYGENLIQNMQSNSQAGRLVLELSEGWYQLATDQQDRLAGELLAMGQKLRLPAVILADSTNHLIARPATVGKSIIILRR
jgi:hypothetical protein